MTSMYDEPGTLGRTIAEDAAARWPNADRRRAHDAAIVAAWNRGDMEEHARLRAAEGIEPALTPAGRAATAHDIGQLDAAGLAKLHAIAERAGVDPAAVGQRFHVARTRRGLIVMLTVYELDAAGQPVHVMGVPVSSHYIRPVTADELPAACLQAGDR